MSVNKEQFPAAGVNAGQFGSHHVWCNGDWRAPVKGCRWCDPSGDGKNGLWAKYPYGSAEEMDGLVSKHFPNVVRRT